MAQLSRNHTLRESPSRELQVALETYRRTAAAAAAAPAGRTEGLLSIPWVSAASCSLAAGVAGKPSRNGTVLYLISRVSALGGPSKGALRAAAGRYPVCACS